MFVAIGVRALGATLLALAGWWLGIIVGRQVGFEEFLPWGAVRLVAGGTIGALAAPYIIARPAKELTRRFVEIPGTTLVLGTVGITLGLVLAALLSVPFARLPGWAGTVSPAVLAVVLASLGATVMVQREREFLTFLPESRRTAAHGTGRARARVHQVRAIVIHAQGFAACGFSRRAAKTAG